MQLFHWFGDVRTSHAKLAALVPVPELVLARPHARDVEVLGWAAYRVQRMRDNPTPFTRSRTRRPGPGTGRSDRGDNSSERPGVLHWSIPSTRRRPYGNRQGGTLHPRRHSLGRMSTHKTRHKTASEGKGVCSPESHCVRARETASAPYRTIVYVPSRVKRNGVARYQAPRKARLQQCPDAPEECSATHEEWSRQM